MMHCGVIGHPIGHSLSPLLHRLIYRQLGYAAEYSRFDVAPDATSGLIPAMKTLGLRGLNVTSPHKEAVVPLVDQLSPTATDIGAVNTLFLREDGTVLGDNTDSYGFARSLAYHGIPIGGARFVLCGNSGAGKAVVHALTSHGAAEVLVASTRPGEGVISYAQLAELEPRDVIINCTPVGMAPNTEKSVVDSGVLRRFGAAVDLIYSPPETLFLRHAKEEGIPAINGLWMLIFQGIRSFEVWTGEDTSKVDADAIYHCLKDELL